MSTRDMFKTKLNSWGVFHREAKNTSVVMYFESTILAQVPIIELESIVEVSCMTTLFRICVCIERDPSMQAMACLDNFSDVQRNEARSIDPTA